MKKIYLAIAVCFGSLGLMAQNSFVSDGTVNSNNSQVTIHDLLDRMGTIGNSLGEVGDYFTPSEQRMLNHHFNQNPEFAPVVLTMHLPRTLRQAQVLHVPTRFVSQTTICISLLICPENLV